MLTRIFGTNRWSAIVRGAALRGLEGPIIIKQKSNLNYGTDVALPFRDGVDSESDSVVDPMTKVKMAKGYMDWIYLKVSIGKENQQCACTKYSLIKGEDIPRNTIKSRTYIWTHVEGGSLTKTCALYVSNMAIAPEKENHYCEFSLLVCYASEYSLCINSRHERVRN
jgi:hypothetical protein